MSITSKSSTQRQFNNNNESKESRVTILVIDQKQKNIFLKKQRIKKTT